MKITIFKEEKLEPRISIVPETIKKFVSLGIDILIEAGAGQSLYTDNDFVKAGAKIIKDSDSLYDTDIVLQVSCPKEKHLKKLKKSTLVVALLDPFVTQDNIKALLKSKVTSMALEFVPRSTYAQKMDVLSSQANLAGYAAVLMAVARSNKVLPMMVTPAGTITPSKVFVIGAGVAGLQAIATAKRLGAQVEAFDTRPAVEEQVRSLGAKFLKIDLGSTGESDQGYAKELTKEQLSKQQQLMTKACEQADIVITTAQIFGKKAPTIITDDMLSGMKKGSIIVDLAIETGGNVEGSQLDTDVEKKGVLIIGKSNVSRQVATDASKVFANNVYYLIEEFYDKDKKSMDFNLNLDIANALITTKDGQLIHPLLQDKNKGDK